MGTIKTKQHDADVFEFIKNYVDKEEKRQDSYQLIEMMEELTHQKAKMWGDSMIGCGKYHYQSERSTQEGDWFPIGFSPRKTALSLYVFTGLPEHEYLLKDLGKFKKGKACIYVKKLSDINLKCLQKIMKVTLQYIDEKWGLIEEQKGGKDNDNPIL